MNNSTRQLVDQLYEDRLATLLSVQDMVEAVIDALEVGEGQSREQVQEWVPLQELSHDGSGRWEE